MSFKGGRKVGRAYTAIMLKWWYKSHIGYGIVGNKDRAMALYQYKIAIQRDMGTISNQNLTNSY